MSPALTKLVLIIEQAQFFDDVVHDEVNVDCRLTPYTLFVCLTQLADHINGKTLIRV